MTSPTQIAANRRNACAATGPRSEAGKARSRGNARRHGLDAMPGPAFARRIEVLAAALLGDRPCPPDALLLARSAAMAGWLVAQVRQEKAKQWTQPIDVALARLARLERYERRALSRRKRALSRLDTLSAATAGGSPTDD